MSASGKGATDETLRYNQLNAGQLSIDAKGGIAAQAGQHVNLDQLARQPGLGWVDQIRNDPKLATSAQTQWQRVQEAHDQWEYRQSGMGPVSAALVAVMVGAVAAPAAASAGAAVGGAAGAATGSAMAGTAAGGAVQAGVLALSNQVGASFFNNGGDLGKVFKELGESESVKNLATAIVTGGVLSGMGFNPLGLPTPGSGALKFFTQLANNLQTQTASALIRTAINGGSLEDSLQDALKNALINSMAASAANGIGDLKEAGALNGFTNKIAHLMAGCAAGAAKSGGGDGCAPGAIGAAVGELAAEGIGRTDNTVYMAGLFGGLAAALAGGDNEAVAIANWAGSNAAANNRMAHPGEYALAEKHAKLIAKKLNVSEQEAEGRIVAEILRNSDQGFATGTGGVHDYAVRRILGCGLLNCNGNENDPNYANSDYNSQFISANQGAFDAGLSQLPTGMTHDQLVIQNLKDNPVSTAIVGTAMIGAGVAVAGPAAFLPRLLAGGAGAGFNVVFQAPGDQPMNWWDVGIAGVTGFITGGASNWRQGLPAATAINAGGAFAGSIISGENPNAAIGGAVAGTAFGYPVGKAFEKPAGAIFNRWNRPLWVPAGPYEMVKPNPPSVVPGAVGGIGSSAAQEVVGDSVKNNLQRTP